MSSSSSSSLILDKFRGCMIGAVIGDCVGSPVECQYWSGISKDVVSKQFVPSTKIRKKPYTDDTAMSLDVAESLVESSGFDARHMASRFISTYYKDPHRGYGGSVTQVFAKLRDSRCSDPFLPASEQFDGSGSYGNGASMRVHPISLYCYTSKSVQRVVEVAKASAKITHSNPDGIAGAVIQASAVYWALHDIPPCTILSLLSEKVDVSIPFSNQLKAVQTLIKDQEYENDEKRALEILGNDISAVRSVPTSIYSFIKAANSKDDSQNTPLFERSLRIAIGFGGDTDTIASMTGAISGAYYGASSIPQYLISQCEGTDSAKNLADKLFDSFYK